MDNLEPKPSFWEANPNLKTIIVTFVVAIIAIGVGQIIFNRWSVNYRQKAYQATEKSLPMHQVNLTKPTVLADFELYGNKLTFQKYNNLTLTLPSGWYWSPETNTSNGLLGLIANYPKADQYTESTQPADFLFIALSVAPKGTMDIGLNLKKDSDFQQSFSIKNGSATLYTFNQNKPSSIGMVLPADFISIVSSTFNQDYEFLLNHSTAVSSPSPKLKQTMLQILQSMSFGK